MKKIISIFLLIAMLFSCGLVATAAEGDTSVGAAEVEFLSSLGIMKADANPDGTITREEMAKIIMMCLGQGANVPAQDTVYTDVNASNAYSGYIQLAYNTGLMVGDGSGKFNPKGNVTYNQTVKLLIHAIGHEAYALSMGGYPAGYLMTATNNGMLTGTAPTGEAAIARGVAAIIIKNAMNIEIMEKIAYGDGSIQYISREGVTILTKYFNIFKMSGVITGNYYTSLSGASSLKQDEILLDGVTTLKVGTTNAADYIGYAMDLYVKVDENARYNTVVAAYAKENTAVTVASDEILLKTTANKFYYLNEDYKEQYVNIDETADMIYNGVAKFWSASDLIVPNGTITLIDNDADGDADVLVVFNYKNVIVKSVKAADNVVYTLKETGEWANLVIDPESKTVKTIFINSDGTPANVEECDEWNILSVAKSADGSVLKVIKCSDYATGEIVTIGEDSVYINEDVFEIAENIKTNPALAQPTLSREGTFYLDFEGKIAGIDYDSALSDILYGYARKVAASGTGFNRKGEIEVLDDKGEIVVLEFAKEVKFNGTKVDFDVVVASPFVQDGGVAIEQLVSYKLDDEGKICEFYTPQNNFAGTLSEEEMVETFTFDAELTGESAYYQSSLQYFAAKYRINKNTKVFIVPDPSGTAAEKDDKFYYTVSPGSLGYGQYGKALIYDMDADHYAGAVVLYYTQDKYFGTSTPAYIITNISKALNEDDDVVTRFELYSQKGITSTFDVEDDVIVDTEKGTITNLANEDPANLTPEGELKGSLPLSALKVGDIIRYSTLPSGALEKLQLMARLDNLAEMERNFGASNGITSLNAINDAVALYSCYTDIDKIIDGALIISPPSTLEEGTYNSRVFPLGSGARYLRYDTATDELETISKNDLAEGDNIYIFRYNSSTIRFLIVIE